MMKHKTQINFLVLVICLVFGIWILGFQAQAGTQHNVRGWAWAGSTDLAPNAWGWISFNCIDMEASTGKTCVTNVIDPATQLWDYGVKIESNGNFSGYAWSPYLGWISFDPSDGAIARYDWTAGQISGWAKILSLGNDGWIKLRKDPADSGPDYGVDVLTNGTFGGTSDCDGNLGGPTNCGFAWNNKIGWVQFSANCWGQGCTPTGIVNQAPSASNLTVATTDTCSGNGINSDTTFSWDYSGPEPWDQQSAYRIEVHTNNSYSDLIWQTDPEGNGWTEEATPRWPQTNITPYTGQFYWRLKLRDSSNSSTAESDWFNGPSFTLPWQNIQVDFTWDPQNPLPDTPTNFTNATICDASACNSWSWTFNPDGSPISGSGQGPHTITYPSSGSKSTILTVTNILGTSCSKTKNPGVAGVPVWRRWLPF